MNRAVRWKRAVARACIAVSLAVLVLYAVAVTVPWHRAGVTPADCIAPVIAVVCGLAYLRPAGRRP